MNIPKNEIEIALWNCRERIREIAEEEDSDMTVAMTIACGDLREGLKEVALGVRAWEEPDEDEPLPEGHTFIRH